MNEQEKPEHGPRGWHFFILDGEEELNPAKFPSIPIGAGVPAIPPNKPKNLTGDILIIDGPEETRS